MKNLEKKSLKKTWNLRGTSRNLRGTFAEPSGNPKGNLKGNLKGTLRNPRNLRGTSRNLAEPCGTCPAREILKKTIAEPCGTLRNLRGTSRNPAEPSQREILKKV